MTLDLAFQETGDKPTVVILHGVFGSKRNWGGISKALAADYRVLTLDLRNHGDSPWMDTMSYPEMAGDLVRFIERQVTAGGADVPMVVGHSMGGKVAMIAATTRPDLVSRLAIVDVAPVTYPPALQKFADAMRAVPLDRYGKRSEVGDALAESIADAGIRAFLMQNLVNDGNKLRWTLNIDVIAENMPEISAFPDLDAEQRYEGPTLFLNGAKSDYVTESSHPKIKALFPEAEIDTIDGAGHWVHAEKPAEFLGRLRAFLDT